MLNFSEMFHYYYKYFFWYYAALRALPLPENTEPLLGATYLTVKGYYIPGLIWD